MGFMRFDMRSLTLFTAATLALTSCAQLPFAAKESFEEKIGVQLFMWNWESVAAECEYLAAVGIDWALVSPPQEHVSGEQWWVGYQPVSYQLESQFGTRIEFEEMVSSCSNQGVEIYVDAVINHMSGASEGMGFAGTQYAKYEYGDLYKRSDFHSCDATVDGQIADWADVSQVQECELLGLSDLNTSDPKVQEKIVAYLQDLIDLGVTGFRIDAAKHIAVSDLTAIKSSLPQDIEFIQEVIPGTPMAEPSDYFETGAIFGFDLAYQLASMFNQEAAFMPDVSTESPWITPSNKTVVMVSNHDTERNGESLNYYQAQKFEAATALMLALGYGQPMLYSSFAFDDYDWAPKDESGLVLDAKCAETSAIYFENHQAGSWLCQHRMRSVNGMIEFRKLTAGKEIANASNTESVLSFQRGDSALFAVNVTGAKVSGLELSTTLADGKYVDQITGAEFDVSGGYLPLQLEPYGSVALTKK